MTQSSLPLWRRQPERGSLRVMIVAARLALLLGQRTARLFLLPACLYFMIAAPKARTASRDYLRRVLERNVTWQDVCRHFLFFGTCLLDRLYFLAGRYELPDLTITNEETIIDATRDGKGCLLLSAHFGSFEALLALSRIKHSRAPSLLMYQENARKVQALFKAINPDLELDIIDLGRPNALILAAERIRSGHCVGLLADRDLNGRDLLAMPFLGDNALFPRGPYRLAMALRCPVVMVVGLHQGMGRYEIVFQPLSSALSARPSNPELWVEETMRCYTRNLEQLCRAAPLNWFNYFDFWSKGSR